jgi:hypothetical protein
MNANPTVETVMVSGHRLILVIRIYPALQQLTDGLKLRGMAIGDLGVVPADNLIRAARAAWPAFRAANR